MNPLPPPETPRILFLFSDTGGGHRSATEAMIEALALEFGDRIQAEMVDFFRDYAPPPFDRFPEMYPEMVKTPQAWGLSFHLSNGRRRVKLLSGIAWPYVRRAIRRLAHQHPADLIVSVHPLINTPMLRALGTPRPPYIVVVTDLVTAHAFWYHRQADLTIVPTEPARQLALYHRLDPARVQVIGLPVADRFCRPTAEGYTIRQRLGWPLDQPMTLLVGGGDGMGPLEQTARALASSGLKTSLAIITGRNAALEARLRAQAWPQPTFIYGFVREMPDFMRAADILVTKAGPGTISEALDASLPVVLSSRLPGQEDGNVRYVVDAGAGIWAPTLEAIVAAARAWLTDPAAHQRAVEACRRLARPEAARQIARLLGKRLGVPPLPPAPGLAPHLPPLDAPSR